MSDLRRRKLHKADSKRNQGDSHKAKAAATSLADTKPTLHVLKTAWQVAGVLVACYIGFKYANYIRTRHENDMWFTNIKEVEREISFRTESGLYYSYYKQLVNAPSIIDGLYELTHDTKTEALRTINILERFNVYQEVVLSILYRWFVPKSLGAIFFYIHSVFALHGMYIACIFATAWLLSGTWLAGLLASTFFVFNGPDTSRIFFTIPLRESFSIPFIYLHFAAVTVYFRAELSKKLEILSIVVMVISTLCFVITWQFSQFVLLMECFALYGVYVLDIVPRKKVSTVIFIGCACLITCCILQFINDMILVSLVLSFSFAALVVMIAREECNSHRGVVIEALKVIGMIVAVFAITITVNLTLKMILKVDSDEHVFKFLMAKFGYGEALKHDFDAMLYLCEATFQMLPLDTFERLSYGVVFPCYVVGCLVLLLAMALSVFNNWGEKKSRDKGGDSLIHRYPELMFNLILSVFLGILAMSTLRMKFLWTPHICVMGASTVCHMDVSTWLLEKAKELRYTMASAIPHLIPVTLMAMLLYGRLASYQEQLAQLREFLDPDTVELMGFINNNTTPNSAFMGSMQLLAAVRLSTGRPITNHPHYENKFLRKRTKEVYQVYARRSPSEVHRILVNHGANYIILENSICYARNKATSACRLPDILDLDNGHELETDIYGPGQGDVPRFCHAIKTMGGDFLIYFKKVFENNTFYIYEVLRRP